MLRISEKAGAKGARLLQLEGRVAGPWVEELRKCCQPALEGGERVTLLLVNVDFVSPEGISLLNALEAGGVRLRRCPPFIQEQLKRGTA